MKIFDSIKTWWNRPRTYRYGFGWTLYYIDGGHDRWWDSYDTIEEAIAAKKDLAEKIKTAIDTKQTLIMGLNEVFAGGVIGRASFENIIEY